MNPGVIERSRANGSAHAMRNPRKAAKMLVHLRERDIPAAQARRDTLEVQRLEAIAQGIEDVLSEDGVYRLCRRCGAPIKDEQQPGWRESYGPDCWAKVNR